MSRSSGDSGNSKGSSASTNDDAFISFAFAIVSVVAFFMFVPLLWAGTKELIAKLKERFGSNGAVSASARKKMIDGEEESVFAGFEDVGIVWSQVKYLVTNPGDVGIAATSMVAHPKTTMRYILPRFLRFCFRPKVFVLVLWFTLLSSVLYTTLTYDPYAALGLDQTATWPEVKKAYRQLVSINHPDRNHTAEAKVIWPKIQRAYKSIGNKEKGMEDEKDSQEEFSVGVALPSWMLQNEKVTLLILLVVLFLVPYYAYKTLFGGTQERQIQAVFDNIDLANAEVESILTQKIGVPEDKNLRQRRADRSRIYKSLLALGVIDPTTPAIVVETSLPPLKELRVRLQTKNGQSLRDQHAWLNEERAVAMAKFFDETDAAASRELDEALRAAEKASANGLLTGAALAAEAFMLKQVFDSVHRDLEEYSTIIGSATITCKKMLKLQDQILDAVRELVKQAKPNTARVTSELIEAPAKLEELCKELRVMTAKFVEQRNRDRQMEMLRQVAAENGGRLPPQLAQQAMEMGLFNQKRK